MSVPANIATNKKHYRQSLLKDITHHVNLLADRIYALLPNGTRLLIAITGPPGSGKSTLASELSRRLTLKKYMNVVVPMDGFHLDNSLLEINGLLGQKGAPETFDVYGFLRFISALKNGENVVAPTFDRGRDIAIAGAIHVPPECPIVIFLM